MANSSTDLLFLDRMTLRGILCDSSQGERSVPSRVFNFLFAFLSCLGDPLPPGHLLSEREELALRQLSGAQVLSSQDQLTYLLRLPRGSYLESTHRAARLCTISSRYDPLFFIPFLGSQMEEQGLKVFRGVSTKILCVSNCF